VPPRVPPHSPPPAETGPQPSGPASQIGVGGCPQDVLDVWVSEGRRTQLARSTQAMPDRGGNLLIGTGCGLAKRCPGGYAPPKSVLGGIIESHLGN
jgi:hypothetical protein